MAWSQSTVNSRLAVACEQAPRWGLGATRKIGDPDIFVLYPTWETGIYIL